MPRWYTWEFIEVFAESWKRNFHALILQHPKCQEEQMWVVSRKSTNRYSTCAGCDKKKCIGPNALYLCVSGLLLLKQEKVIETDHHFCIKKKCVTEIKTRISQYQKFGEYGGYRGYRTSKRGRPSHCPKCWIYYHLMLNLSLLLYTFWTPGVHQRVL